MREGSHGFSQGRSIQHSVTIYPTNQGLGDVGPRLVAPANHNWFTRSILMSLLSHSVQALAFLTEIPVLLLAHPIFIKS